jgi:hypothetical protein
MGLGVRAGEWSKGKGTPRGMGLPHRKGSNNNNTHAHTQPAPPEDRGLVFMWPCLRPTAHRQCVFPWRLVSDRRHRSALISPCGPSFATRNGKWEPGMRSILYFGARGWEKLFAGAGSLSIVPSKRDVVVLVGAYGDSAFFF